MLTQSRQVVSTSLLQLAHLILTLAPLLTAEARHARECPSVVSLWNDSITLTNMTRFTDVWLVSYAFCFFFEAVTTHVNGSWRTWFGQLAPKVQRMFILLTLLSTFRILHAEDQLSLCLYSLPLCGTVLGICEFTIYAASRK